MILLDASVLIAYLRAQSPAIEQVFASGECAISGPTRAEVLHGARNEPDLQRLTGLLNQFTQISAPSGIWDALGRNLYLLRIRGIAVPFTDALVATTGMLVDAEVWAYDTHFALMQPVLAGLRLFAGPNP